MFITLQNFIQQSLNQGFVHIQNTCVICRWFAMVKVGGLRWWKSVVCDGESLNYSVYGPNFNMHGTKNEVLHHRFLQYMWPNPQFPADLVTFAEEILIKGKLHFLCSINYFVIAMCKMIYPFIYFWTVVVINLFIVFNTFESCMEYKRY